MFTKRSSPQRVDSRHDRSHHIPAGAESLQLCFGSGDDTHIVAIPAISWSNHPISRGKLQAGIGLVQLLSGRKPRSRFRELTLC
jgi:hypothetical protein